MRREVSFGEAMQFLDSSHCYYTTVTFKLGNKTYCYQKRENKLVYFNEKTMKREVSSLTINDAFQGKWFLGGE